LSLLQRLSKISLYSMRMLEKIKMSLSEQREIRRRVWNRRCRLRGLRNSTAALAAAAPARQTQINGGASPCQMCGWQSIKPLLTWSHVQYIHLRIVQYYVQYDTRNKEQVGMHRIFPYCQLFPYSESRLFVHVKIGQHRKVYYCYCRLYYCEFWLYLVIVWVTEQ